VATPVPTAFVAVMAQLYSNPFDSAVTTIGLDAAVPVRTLPVAVQVAVYAEIAEPPAETGAVKAIETLPFPAVATTFVGAPGADVDVGGVVVPEPVPPSLLAQAASEIASAEATRTTTQRASDDFMSEKDGRGRTNASLLAAEAGQSCSRDS
jgi:hypothetical protein